VAFNTTILAHCDAVWGGRQPSVDLDMTFDQLSVSSLDVLQIIFRIEESRGITVDIDQFYEVKSLKNVVDYVDQAIS
jgi:acyl carrier protein